MGLFKSREERKIERNIEIRKGINSIKRQINKLEKHEREYLDKAKRAKRLGSASQLGFLKQTLKKTMGQRVLMERQMLNIETACQIKDQAEAHGQFAGAMTAISRSIGEMFKQTDLAKTQMQFEKAMARAQNMEERMDMFLDISAQSMFGAEGATGGELVSDDQIDNLISEEIAHEESSEIGGEIAEGLSEIERELGRGEK